MHQSTLSFWTGTDYAATPPLTVTFTVGDGDDATETAMILAVDDEIAENEESFTVSIGSTDPPSMIGTPPSSQTATIMASDRK